MVTAEENELLTRVGPGTPMGALLRRYWHPIAARAGDGRALDEARPPAGRRPRALQGSQRPLRPDRRVLSAPARVAALRHPDSRRHSLPVSRLEVRRRRALPRAAERTRRQHVQRQGHDRRLSGRGARRAAVGVSRTAAGAAGPAARRLRRRGRDPAASGTAIVPCNWLQIMENSVDPIHTEWLHGKLYEFVEERAASRSRSRATT